MQSKILSAPASDPAYGELAAMVARGEAKFVGERYDTRGVKEIAVAPKAALRRNPEIRVGAGFFSSALRDYEDWKEKWWREAIQNAVDAGARTVTCTVTETESGVLVNCEDDGAGMDEDVLINKFLVLGETTKATATGTTGGFGKAKELLVLPWLRWEVHSRDIVVKGSGLHYEQRTEMPRKGTRLGVLMAPDQTTTHACAMAFIGKCHIPGVQFVVNGEEVKANLRKGEHIRDFDEGVASIYHNKSDKHEFSQRLLVRANGIFMFGMGVPYGVPGTLVLELNRPSIELLSANRDGFRSTSLRYAVNDFTNELAANTKSALKKRKNLIREKFKGTGRFSSGVSAADFFGDMLDLQGIMMPAGGKGKNVILSPDQIGAAVQALKAVSARMTAEAAAYPTNLVVPPEIAEEMLGHLEIRGSTHMEAVLKQLAWEPDFYLINEVEGWRVPRKFYPEAMTPRIKQLLQFWAQCCRYCLIQLGSANIYGVGFIFDETAGAAHLYEDGDHWILLNPFRDMSKDREEVRRLASKEDLHWLYAAAVHECTHMADSVSYHDESFAAALTTNFAKTVGGLKKLAAIRQAIVRRT